MNDKHRYIHTPKSAGFVKAVKWDGGNLQEIIEAFPELEITFEGEYLKVFETGRHVETVPKGYYLIEVEEPQRINTIKLSVFDAEFFEKEHSPIDPLANPPKEFWEPRPPMKSRPALKKTDKYEAYDKRPGKLEGKVEPLLLITDERGFLQLVVNNDQIIPYNTGITVKDNIDEPVEVTATFKVNMGRKTE